MERRKFIGNILKGLGASFIPLSVIGDLLQSEHGSINISDADDWVINYTTKEIKYVGDVNHPGITLRELYNFLKNEWETEEELIPFKFPLATTDKK